MRAHVAVLMAAAAVVLLSPPRWVGVASRLVGFVQLPAGGRHVAHTVVGPAFRLRVGGRMSAAPVLVIAALLAGVVAGAVAALLAAVGAAVGVSILRAKHAESAAEARQGADLEFLAALAAELRSGRHPAAALVAVPGPDDAGLAAALSAARATAMLGGDVSATLRRNGSNPALAKLAAAWQLSEECGAPLADFVAQVAADVRATAELTRRTRVELTGARATGLALAILPLLGVALGAAMGADPLRVLLHTPAGAACSVAGLAFELAGLAWIRRLTSNTR